VLVAAGTEGSVLYATDDEENEKLAQEKRDLLA
jgi:hypothetical protein